MADRSTNVVGSAEVAFSSIDGSAHTRGVEITPKLEGTDEVQVQMVVSNTSATTQTVAGVYDNMLFICDMQGRKALPVPPQQSVTLETDSPFKLKGSVTGVTYVVGQLFARGIYALRSGGASGVGGLGGGGGAGGSGGEQRAYSGSGPRPGQLA